MERVDVMSAIWALRREEGDEADWLESPVSRDTSEEWGSGPLKENECAASPAS